MKTRHFVSLFALVLICWSISSCAFTAGPDGSKSGTLDGKATAAIIKIIAAK